jgi:hypothetical protein
MNDANVLIDTISYPGIGVTRKRKSG